MDITTFRQTLTAAQPPAGLSAALQALWYDGKGDWDAAHDCLQNGDDLHSSWVHAYLHRKEGDPSNAAYWYHRADKPVARGTLDEEWAAITSALLARP